MQNENDAAEAHSSRQVAAARPAGESAFLTYVPTESYELRYATIVVTEPLVA